MSKNTLSPFSYALRRSMGTAIKFVIAVPICFLLFALLSDVVKNGKGIDGGFSFGIFAFFITISLLAPLLAATGAVYGFIFHLYKAKQNRDIIYLKTPFVSLNFFVWAGSLCLLIFIILLTCHPNFAPV